MVTKTGTARSTLFAAWWLWVSGVPGDSVMVGYKPGEESTLVEMFDPETYELVRV